MSFSPKNRRLFPDWNSFNSLETKSISELRPLIDLIKKEFFKRDRPHWGSWGCAGGWCSQNPDKLDCYSVRHLTNSCKWDYTGVLAVALFPD